MVVIDTLAGLPDFKSFELIRTVPGEEYAANCLRIDRQGPQPLPVDLVHEKLARSSRRRQKPAPSALGRRGRRPPGLLQTDAQRSRRLQDPRPQRPAGRTPLRCRTHQNHHRGNRPGGRGHRGRVVVQRQTPRASLSAHRAGAGFRQNRSI